MENMKEMKLYTEIKAAMMEVITSEENGREWMKIAREQLADVKTLINAAKKINKVDLIPQQLIDSIREEIAAEKEAANQNAETACNAAAGDEIPQTPDAQ